MDSMVIRKAKQIKGEITVAADKSISHRAVMLSALAQGESVVRNFLEAEDTLSTCNCMRSMAVNIKKTGAELIIKGRGLQGLKEPESVLYCGNSGTTTRLLTGILAGLPFFSVLNGDNSLNQRPMKRVVEPLELMGAQIMGRHGGNYLPLAIKGHNLKGIKYKLPVPSAQVKSAILLAALNAQGVSEIIESKKSRDHTENMLKAMGGSIQVDELGVRLYPGKELSPQDFLVPGDISSAAFFIVAASIIPNSELKISDVGINPTRAGIIEVLQKMGGGIKIENQRQIGGEPIADIIVSSSPLKAANVQGELIPRLIDEIPILAVAMAAAEGESVVRGAEELRVKETDRIAAICTELNKMGVIIEELEDGFVIKGKGVPFAGCRVSSHGDHRIAMSLAIAGLAAQEETIIDNTSVSKYLLPYVLGYLA
jgi:3-phosphoshikimate 1-carboxyvinyltransferase